MFGPMKPMPLNDYLRVGIITIDISAYLHSVDAITCYLHLHNSYSYIILNCIPFHIITNNTDLQSNWSRHRRQVCSFREDGSWD